VDTCLRRAFLFDELVPMVPAKFIDGVTVVFIKTCDMPAKSVSSPAFLSVNIHGIALSLTCRLSSLIGSVFRYGLCVAILTDKISIVFCEFGVVLCEWLFTNSTD
jgi:hypothetical protein